MYISGVVRFINALHGAKYEFRDVNVQGRP